MIASHQTGSRLVFFLPSLVTVGLALASCTRPDASPAPAPMGRASGDTIPTLGTATPRVVVSLYTDYQCPNCRRALDVAQRLVDGWPEDVQVRFRHLPLEIHPLAVPAAIAAQAAHRQGHFLCMHGGLAKTRGIWNELDAAHFRDYLLDVLAPRCELDRATFERDLADPALERFVQDERERARDLEVPGTPALYVNGLEADAWPRAGRSRARLVSALIRRELRDIEAGGVGLGRCPDDADWACRLFDRVASNVGDDARARLVLGDELAP